MSLCSTQRQCTHMPAHTGSDEPSEPSEPVGARSWHAPVGAKHVRRARRKPAPLQHQRADTDLSPTGTPLPRARSVALRSAAHVPMRSCEADEREQADQCTRGGGLAGSHAEMRGVEWWWVGVMGWLRSAEKWMGASRVRGPCIGEGAGRKCGGVGRHGRRGAGLCAHRTVAVTHHDFAKGGV